MKIFYKNTEVPLEILKHKITINAKANIVAFICNSDLDCLAAEIYRTVTDQSVFIIPSYLQKNTINKLILHVKPDIIYVMNNGEFKDSFCNLKLRGSISLIPGSILFVTSSSTGEPKVVYKTKSQLHFEIHRYIKMYDITREDTLFPIVPLFHNYGYVCGLLTAYHADASLIIQDNLYPSKIVDISNRYNANIWLSVPDFYKQLLICSKELSYELKRAICSCSKVDNDLLTKFKSKFGIPLTQQYGSTETGSLAISDEVDCANQFTIFMEGVELNCDKRSGEILVHSSETMGSYIINNKVVKIPNNPYHTGDVGKVENNKMVITGRLDDIINIAGNKVSLTYLQKEILKCKGINSVSIEFKRTTYSAYLICYFSSDIISETIVREFCKHELPKHFIPQKYVKVPLPWKQNNFFKE